MSINKPYGGAGDLPSALPVFPLSGALLLPRGELPLNIFEARYLAMVDDALATHRMIGMVQPNGGDPGKPDLFTVGCAGRITQIAETGDGRYMLALTGVARFRVVTELDATTLYRQCHVDFASFAEDFLETRGIETVDRKAVLDALRCFAEAHRLEINWRGIEEAPNDALVNALAMMSPFGPREKQALLEASDIKTRAEVLVAITEMELARSRQAETRLQ